jgi:catechol 2,3-dioxygenase-like lactoylglutathione lyase family enzyme
VAPGGLANGGAAPTITGKARGRNAMVKKRGADETPFMEAPAYGRSLAGLSINLLVKNIARAVAFERDVLGAAVVYADADFAVLRWRAASDASGNAPESATSEWMLHADHTYGSHPLLGLTGDGAVRGAGAELRLHGCDPDAAVARAERLGHVVLAAPADKPHGLREAYIADPDGYVWVPDVPTRG